MADEALSNLSNWNFKEKHVNANLTGGKFISAESVLVCAGRARLTDGSSEQVTPGADQVSTEVYPIGVLENVMVAQNAALQKLFEIGSSRSYFIPGRVIGSVTLGRILYNGPSLLRVLYALYRASAEDDPLLTSAFPTPEGNGILVGEEGEIPYPQTTPGSGQLWIDLANELFKRPIGLAFFMQDQFQQDYAQFYLEDCYVQGHQFSVSATSMLIAEGVTMQFDKAVPLQLDAETLTSQSSGGDLTPPGSF